MYDFIAVICISIVGFTLLVLALVIGFGLWEVWSTKRHIDKIVKDQNNEISVRDRIRLYIKAKEW